MKLTLSRLELTYISWTGVCVQLKYGLCTINGQLIVFLASGISLIRLQLDYKKFKSR
jgi:hypothetical protein